MKKEIKSISTTCKTEVNSIKFALNEVCNSIRSQSIFWKQLSIGKVLVRANYATSPVFSILQPKSKHQL
jgi:hypothetical protein